MLEFYILTLGIPAAAALVLVPVTERHREGPIFALAMLAMAAVVLMVTLLALEFAPKPTTLGACFAVAMTGAVVGALIALALPAIGRLVRKRRG